MLALDIILGSNSIYASFSFSKYVTLALGLLAAGLVFLRFMIEASGGNRVRINSNSLMALFIFLFVVVFYLFAQNVFFGRKTLDNWLIIWDCLSFLPPRCGCMWGFLDIAASWTSTSNSW